MNLSMTSALADAYKSGSQRAGKVTEAWGAENFYCPHCSSPKLDWLKPNTKASDYRCPVCGYWYQLKSKKTQLGNTMADGAYRAMMEAIQNDQTPNFFYMQYDPETWNVKNILLIPHFAISPSAVMKRNPLSISARRAGWVGCNISLRNIPQSVKIPVVYESAVIPLADVRRKYRKAQKQVDGLTVGQRGWRLDVLRIVQSFGREEFSTADVYAFERELEKLHPDNKHIRDKIRQQLQVLRDAGLLLHAGRSVWRLP